MEPIKYLHWSLEYSIVQCTVIQNLIFHFKCIIPWFFLWLSDLAAFLLGTQTHRLDFKSVVSLPFSVYRYHSIAFAIESNLENFFRLELNSNSTSLKWLSKSTSSTGEFSIYIWLHIYRMSIWICIAALLKQTFKAFCDI